MLEINRSVRSWNRSQRRRHQENDFDIQFDWNRPLNQCCYGILTNISSKDALSNKNQLLAYLNLFIKYCLYRYGKLPNTAEQKNSSNDQCVQLSFSDTDILCCLRISLFHEVSEVRAACLRAIRYFVQNKQTLSVLLELNLQHMIARSLDIILDNKIERIQALRLVRHIMSIEPNAFPLALGRCLCAISSDNFIENDVLLRVFWATIAELTVINAIISARSGCINVLTKCALNSLIGTNLSEFDDYPSHHNKNRNNHNNNNPAGTITNLVSGRIANNLTIPYTSIAISEAILSSFIHLFNFPETRKLLQPNGSDLFYFISPFTDLYSFLHASKAAREEKESHIFHLTDHYGGAGDDHHYKMHFDFKENKPHRPNKQYQLQQASFMNDEQRTKKYLGCKNAILSILRSWCGMFFMCRVVNINYSDKILYLNLLGENDLVLKRKIRRSKLECIESNSINSDNCCRSQNHGFDTLNPLESLITILHLPYVEVHRHLLELFYEVFGLRAPDCPENFEEAIKCFYFSYPLKSASKYAAFSSNSAHTRDYFPDEWELYDGFIIKEAEDILPCRSSGRLNFIINYHALLLQSLVEFGLLEALCKVILNSHDKSIINLATILIGELLHFSGKYLPSSYAHRCQSLPTLVAASISGCRETRHRALMTISNLNCIHEIKKQGPKPVSLFLQQQIYFCQTTDKNIPVKTKPRSASISKIQEEIIQTSIKNSCVLRRSSYQDWNWHIIADLLKHPNEILKKLEDKDVCAFINRLLEFFLPTKRQFSSISKNSGLGSSDTTGTSSPPASPNPTTGRFEVFYFDNPRLICTVAIYFIDFLLQADETKASVYIEEFILDLDNCLKNIATKNASMSEILIPSRLLPTLSRYYFLLLGRFTHFPIGKKWLSKTNIYQYLLELVNLSSNSSNEVYTKLIISSLDYSEVHISRSILSKVLTSPNESSRLYSTKFMRVLLRANVPDFNKWALDLLITQLYDPSFVVRLEALNILDEACSENLNYLEPIQSHPSILLNLGDHGVIFFTRFASYPFGLNMLKEKNILEIELNRWKNQYCFRYVRLVEDSLNECFSCHQKGITGKYGRRSEKKQFQDLKPSNMASYLLPHLYGQLVQTFEGLKIIKENSILEETLKIVENQMPRFIETTVDAPKASNQNNVENRPTEVDVLKMKAALWSIGHIASSEFGIEYVLSHPQPLFDWLTLLIEQALILSLRATGFHVICLIASTETGAQTLSKYGWSAIRHSHHDSFPIDKQEFENYHLFSKTSSLSMFDEECVQEPSSNLNPSNYTYPSLYSNDDNSSQTIVGHNSACQFSISSNSSSSSSSYLSILPPTGNYYSKINEMKSLKTSNPSETIKKIPSSQDNSMSSTTSLYSNTSSIGSLMSGVKTATTTTITDSSTNRIRSSSDCVCGNVSASNQLMDFNSKPEYKDSGIMDPNSDCIPLDKLGKHTLSPLRNRKISAPCFSCSTNIQQVRISSNSNENRSDGGGAESRSTSFTEDSTTSGGINNVTDQQKNERNVSFLETTTATNKETEASSSSSQSHEPKLLKNNRTSSSLERKTPVVMIQDDPYPSSIDAFGYAQLRAIQKRRVESLSGNMFFNYRNRPETPFYNDSSHGNNEGNIKNKSEVQRKISRSSPISSNSNTNHFNFASNLFVDQQKQRSLSGSSQISNQSSENVLTETINNSYEKSNFMCLCLPQSLSSIFYLDESSESNNKKRVKFLYETNEHYKNLKKPFPKGTIPLEKYDHVISNCLLCCRKTDCPSENNSNANADVSQHQEVLSLVSRLIPNQTSKHAEQGLLNLKQKFPNLFEDFCLFSDVCNQMELNNFRAQSRRFLHELFADINLEPFYQIAGTILQKHPQEC